MASFKSSRQSATTKPGISTSMSNTAPEATGSSPIQMTWKSPLTLDTSMRSPGIPPAFTATCITASPLESASRDGTHAPLDHQSPSANTAEQSTIRKSTETILRCNPSSSRDPSIKLPKLIHRGRNPVPYAGGNPPSGEATVQGITEGQALRGQCFVNPKFAEVDIPRYRRIRRRRKLSK